MQEDELKKNVVQHLLGLSNPKTIVSVLSEYFKIRKPTQSGTMDRIDEFVNKFHSERGIEDLEKILTVRGIKDSKITCDLFGDHYLHIYLADDDSPDWKESPK